MKDYIIWFLSYVFAILASIGVAASFFTLFMVPLFVVWFIVALIAWIICFIYVAGKLI